MMNRGQIYQIDLVGVLYLNRNEKIGKTANRIGICMPCSEGCFFATLR